jgi:hypothetical protein
MNKLNSNFNELKLMRNYPKIYLINYLTDLQMNLNKEEKENYSKVLKIIQSCNYLNYEIKLKAIDEEILFIEQLLANNSIDSSETINKTMKSIDKIKYKIEKLIFSDETILLLFKNYIDYINLLF